MQTNCFCTTCIKLGVENPEEAFFYCRLCLKHFCSEHLCSHLERSLYDEEVPRAIRESLEEPLQKEIPTPLPQGTEDNISEVSNEIRQTFDLRAATEFEISARIKKLFKEIKTLQRELERRMIECSSFTSRLSQEPRRKPRTSVSRTRAKELKAEKAVRALKHLSVEEIKYLFKRSK